MYFNPRAETISKPSDDDDADQITSGEPNDTDHITSDPSSFLFVHQTEEQKRLLLLYGQEICLLDATYKTSQYDIPLFFLCVNTNVGHSVVASFMIANENRNNIKEALETIRMWNPDWHPHFFMCDFDNREIWALENTFKGNYVCMVMSVKSLFLLWLVVSVIYAIIN